MLRRVPPSQRDAAPRRAYLPRKGGGDTKASAVADPLIVSPPPLRGRPARREASSRSREGGTAALFAALFLLAACAPTLTQIRGLPLAGESFFETLAREQRRTAVNLGRQGASLPAAERFATRAAEARAGRISDPEPATDPDTAAARAEILALLDTPARQRCPVFAALALARYDAWADRAAVWPTSQETLRLRGDTLKNLDVLKESCVS